MVILSFSGEFTKLGFLFKVKVLEGEVKKKKSFEDQMHLNPSN